MTGLVRLSTPLSPRAPKRHLFPRLAVKRDAHSTEATSKKVPVRPLLLLREQRLSARSHDGGGSTNVAAARGGVAVAPRLDQLPCGLEGLEDATAALDEPRAKNSFTLIRT